MRLDKQQSQLRAHASLTALNNARIHVKQMSTSTDVLAAYLADTHDSHGVVEFIRQTWPRCRASYLSQVKSQWITLEVISEEFATQYASALDEVDARASKESKKAVLRSAREKLVAFKEMNLSETHAQRGRVNILAVRE